MSASDNLSPSQFDSANMNFFHVSHKSNREGISTTGIDPKSSKGKTEWKGTKQKPVPQLAWFTTKQSAVHDTYPMPNSDIWHSSDVGNWREKEEQGGPYAVSTRKKVSPSKLTRVGHVTSDSQVHWHKEEDCPK